MQTKLLRTGCEYPMVTASYTDKFCSTSPFPAVFCPSPLDRGRGAALLCFCSTPRSCVLADNLGCQVPWPCQLESCGAHAPWAQTTCEVNRITSCRLKLAYYGNTKLYTSHMTQGDLLDCLLIRPGTERLSDQRRTKPLLNFTPPNINATEAGEISP